MSRIWRLSPSAGKPILLEGRAAVKRQRIVPGYPLAIDVQEHMSIGETVVNVVPEIGYLHTGIEKSIQGKRYEAALTCTDRMDYLAPLANNLVYCMAVERLLDLEVPPRAQWLRTL